MKLLVGLGNPGSEYAKTRHNAGFMAIERLAQKYNLPPAEMAASKFHSLLRDGQVAGQRCLLLLPQTYMNRSGQAVAEAMGFYKIDLGDLLVFVDDVALPVGTVRLRADGSDGGHNGLADIERALGTRNYPRLRIGIDPPGIIPQRDYVLGRFTPEQLDKLSPALDSACQAVECWIRSGIAKAMSLYNAKAREA